jgi:hypothetical protein
VSYLWAVSPLVTCGIATPGISLHAAIRLRARAHWIAFAAYTVLLCSSLVLATGAPEKSGRASVAGLLLVLSMVGGTMHALAIRSRVFSAAEPVQNTFDAAVGAAKERRATRAKARELAKGDPVMARELRIGRPDLPRTFDDGGLIDVNAAPPAVLAQLPGMTPQLVDKIVSARDQVDGFVSPEDLSAAAGLPPHLTNELAEYAVFLT